MRKSLTKSLCYLAKTAIKKLNKGIFSSNGNFDTTQRSEPKVPPSHPVASHSAALTDKVPKGGPSLRVLSGGVSRVKSWTQYLHNLQAQLGSGFLPPVMFRVYGFLTSITPEASASKTISAKTLVISDLRDSTQSLRCVFYEIDRNLDPMKIGDCVAVSGRRITNREDLEMQIVSVETFALEEVEPYLARMENFANRALESIN